MTHYPPHSVEQKIDRIDIACAPDFEIYVRVGKYFESSLITRIEATAKPGSNAYVPYVRVWAGDHCVAEFCQHNLVGVYFAPRATPTEEAP